MKILWMVSVAWASLWTGAAAFRPTDDLAWLAGCWESRAGERSILEMWSPPAGGMLMGASRTAVGGAVSAWEHLRIEPRDEGIAYIAHPSGQAETTFTSTSLGQDGFVVENPTHDFPTRISYRRLDGDSFVARVEGPDGSGGLGGFSLRFARVACEVGGGDG